MNLTKISSIRLGLLLSTLGGLLFTLDLPLLRLASAGQWTMICARGVFLFLSITAIWHFLQKRGGKAVPYLAGGAGLAVAATNTLANITYIGAIVETNAANVVFILALIPILTALMSRIFLGEKIHGFTWSATVFSVLGVSIIVWDGVAQSNFLGDAMAIISALCTAAAFTIISASGKNVSTSLAIGSLCSAVIAFTFFDVSPSALLAPASFGVPAWIWIALNGLVAIPLASVLIVNGPRFLPSSDVSMFFMLETVLTPVWIWLLFGETPTRNVFIGGFIVITTLVLHSWWRISRTLHESGLAKA